MIEIPLTNSSLKALIDDEDYELVSQYRWSLSGVYAMSNTQPRFYMHRLILGLKPGDPRRTDHKNGNGLDNRRSNIRIATQAQNRANSNKRVDNTLGYVGVGVNASSYTAYINYNGRRIHIGSFKTLEEAARARDAKSIELYGEFAKLNFP